VSDDAVACYAELYCCVVCCTGQCKQWGGACHAGQGATLFMMGKGQPCTKV
jgi:hypothetical protein